MNLLFDSGVPSTTILIISKEILLIVIDLIDDIQADVAADKFVAAILVQE
jgi:hypothetical protein